jgi:hypothetical protein
MDRAVHLTRELNLQIQQAQRPATRHPAERVGCPSPQLQRAPLHCKRLRSCDINY